INLEIEATCRRNNAARRRREQDTEGSSHTSPVNVCIHDFDDVKEESKKAASNDKHFLQE
ncbi:hypothetical protein L2P99_13480, partial [Staphylococcus aureus]|nr:hypothetical protein [Staphylococcus aureus]